MALKYAGRTLSPDTPFSEYGIKSGSRLLAEPTARYDDPQASSSPSSHSTLNLSSLPPLPTSPMAPKLLHTESQQERDARAALSTANNKAFLVLEKGLIESLNRTDAASRKLKTIESKLPAINLRMQSSERRLEATEKRLEPIERIAKTDTTALRGLENIIMEQKTQLEEQRAELFLQRSKLQQQEVTFQTRFQKQEQHITELTQRMAFLESHLGLSGEAKRLAQKYAVVLNNPVMVRTQSEVEIVRKLGSKLPPDMAKAYAQKN